MTAPPHRPRQALLVGLALVVLYLAWGTSYYAIRIAVESVPPLSAAAMRFLPAGLLLYAWARLRGAPKPGLADWARAGGVGLLLITIGNGLVTVSSRHVPSGIVALLLASVSIWLALFDAALTRARPSTRAFVAIAVGLAGVIVLAGPWRGGLIGAGRGLDLVLVTLSTISWAAGTMIARRAPPPPGALLRDVAIQMLTGGTALAIASIAFGEAAALASLPATADSILAIAYLTLVSSIVGYAVYAWLLAKTTVSRVSTIAFANPLVALVVGTTLGGERVGATTILAGVLLLAAVALLLARPRASRAQPRPEPAAPTPLPHERAPAPGVRVH